MPAAIPCDPRPAAPSGHPHDHFRLEILRIRMSGTPGPRDRARPAPPRLDRGGARPFTARENGVCADRGSSHDPWPPSSPPRSSFRRAETTTTAPSGPAATTYTLTITPTGIGTGAVTSSPAGIDCSTAGGSGCTATFDAGTRVTLTATPAPGMAFGGWSGDGTGTTTRTVTMDRDRAVSAAFDDPDKAVEDIG